MRDRTSTPKAPLTDALKSAMEQSGLTRYEIAKRTGVPPTSLMRFLRGDTSLRLDKADAIANCLGLELVKKRKAK
jgi:transcriptional regulator with XRE-family HTH domain